MASWNQITPDNLRIVTWLQHYENLPLNTFNEQEILTLVSMLDYDLDEMTADEQMSAVFGDYGLENHPAIIWVANHLERNRIDRLAQTYRMIAERDQARQRNELPSPRRRPRYRLGRYAPSA